MWLRCGGYGVRGVVCALVCDDVHNGLASAYLVKGFTGTGNCNQL